MASCQSEAWLRAVTTPAAAWIILWDLQRSKNGCPALLRANPRVRAWLKPRRAEPWVARREKVAADLAHILGLPHASVLVTLVEDPHRGTRPAALARYSRAPSHLKWSRLQQRGPRAVVRAVRRWFGDHRRLLAGVWVLDTWLRNPDRSDRNIMVGYDGERLEAVYFYDWDLSQNWQGDLTGGRWQKVTVAQTSPDVRRRAGLADLMPWIHRVNRLPGEELHRLVHRLPEPFATPAEKALHLRALLARRTRLEAVFAQHLEAGNHDA